MKCSRNKHLDPVLRKYVLMFAVPMGFSCLAGGAYLGYSLVSADAVVASPMLEKIFLATFIAISCGAIGVVLGGLVGTMLHRFAGKRG